MVKQYTNIYLASRWSRQLEMRQARDRIHELTGCRVVSTWIDTDRPTDLNENFFFSDNGNRRFHADLDDIRRSDLLVADVLGGIGQRGGMLIEVGYAAGLGKPVILIGDPVQFGIFGNVFAEIFPDWASAFRNYF